MLFKGMMFVLLALTSASSIAKDWHVQMLNYGSGTESGMIFEPAFIHAQVGDSITFIPTHSGHNVQSYVVPEGESQWKSVLDTSYTINLNQEGVHLYYCPPHLMMGMVGMIQVGNATNFDMLQQKTPRLRSKIALNPERIDDLLKQVIVP